MTPMMDYLRYPILLVLALLVAYAANSILAHLGWNPLGLRTLTW